MRIEQLLERAAAAPLAIALEGAPGIGKTTLWREALISARARGYRVLEASASQPDADLAFVVLADLLEGLPSSVTAVLPLPQRHALAAALALAEETDAPADSQALPRAVLGVLRRLAADTPVVIAIDDEQWLDRPSARVLRFAVSRLRDERVCVLVTRPASRGEDRSLGIGRDPEVVSLLPLGLAATSQLLSDALKRRIPRRLSRRIYDVSGGNPVYALAIAQELYRFDRRGAVMDELRIPRTLAAALERRLSDLPPETQLPLLAVAALANPTLALVRAAIGRFADRHLDAALGAGVVELAGERIRFTHPLLASAHYASATPWRRRELHRRLADVVPDEVERAHHIARAAQNPDRRTSAVLERAAAVAARRGAPEVAAELMRDAGRLTPPELVERRLSRMIGAAEHHHAAGELPEARQLLEDVLADLPTGPIRARTLGALALVRSDDFELGAYLLRQALADVGDDDRMRAEMEIELAELLASRGDFTGRLEHARSAVQFAERTGDDGLVALALAQLGSARADSGDEIGRALFVQAMELEQSSDAPTFRLPSTILGAQLLYSDRFNTARWLLERSLRRAERRGEESLRGRQLARLALLEWQTGDPEAADRYLEAAAETGREQVDGELDCWVTYVSSVIAAYRGQLEHARVKAEATTTLASSSGNDLFGTWASTLLAQVDLWTGGPKRAHRHLGSVRESALDHGLRIIGQMTLPLWSADIEALIALGRHDDAHPILADLRERALAAHNPNANAIAHRCEGLLLAAQGELDRALRQLDAAVAEHASRPVPLEVGRTLLEAGSVLRRARRKSAAKQTLDQALAVLEPLGANLWITRARDERGRLGLRRGAIRNGLTPAERRIAELVQAGMSNGDIAGALHMSRRSVESHLTKIYRELGVRSRSQLAATLAHAAAASPEGGSG